MTDLSLPLSVEVIRHYVYEILVQQRIINNIILTSTNYLKKTLIGRVFSIDCDYSFQSQPNVKFGKKQIDGQVSHSTFVFMCSITDTSSIKKYVLFFIDEA